MPTRARDLVQNAALQSGAHERRMAGFTQRPVDAVQQQAQELVGVLLHTDVGGVAVKVFKSPGKIHR